MTSGGGRLDESSMLSSLSMAEECWATGVSLFRINVRASCSGEVSQRQAGSRPGG